MSANTNLNKAKKAKKDEFYTQLVDIENELKHYRGHFRGKTVYCNCDDPYESNFFKYFAINFNFLELKKLIATSYCPSPVSGTELSFDDILGLNPPLRSSSSLGPNALRERERERERETTSQD